MFSRVEMSLTNFNQAIPYITDEFNSLLDVGWYASAYTLVT